MRLKRRSLKLKVFIAEHEHSISRLKQRRAKLAMKYDNHKAAAYWMVVDVKTRAARAAEWKKIDEKSAKAATAASADT